MKRWTEYIIEAKQKYKTGYLGLNCVASTHDGDKILLEIVYFSITSPSPTYVTSCHAGWWANHENTGEIINALNFGDTPLSTIQTFPAPWDSLVDLGQIIKRDYTQTVDDGWTGLYCKDNLIHIEEP